MLIQWLEVEGWTLFYFCTCQSCDFGSHSSFCPVDWSQGGEIMHVCCSESCLTHDQNIRDFNYYWTAISREDPELSDVPLKTG